MNTHDLRTENDFLREKLKEAMEVIEFYADSYTWVSNSGKVGVNPIYSDMENIPTDRSECRWCGGKRARDFLQKVEGK